MDSSVRRVVAVIVDQYDTYQRGIVETIRERLDRAGYGTLCIAGRDLLARDAMLERTARDIVHPIAAEIDVAGAIVLSTVLGQGFPHAEIRRFAERLGESGPVVSLGAALPGVPSVTLDSDAALEALMEHMTRDPERRRFVFLRGFTEDDDTRVREAAFRRTLARRGIDVDERLVLDGRYRSADAFTAIDALLREGIRFDAVVAANDEMAASAVTALARHGLSVPDDVIVSGFDDSAVALEIQPPLTTVRHPVERRAEAAAELLLAAFGGESPLDPDTRVSIAATFIPRDSSRTDAHERGGDEALVGAFAAPEPRRALGALLHERLARPRPPDDVDVAALVALFLDALLDGSGRFADSLERRLALSSADVDGIRWWRHASRQLRHLLERVPAGVAHPAAMSPLMRALDAMGGMRRVARVRNGVERLAHRQIHELLLARLAGCASAENVWKSLREGLVALEIERAWVVLHDAGEDERDAAERRRDRMANPPATPSAFGIPGERSRLAFALDDEALVAERFERRRILPPRLGTELERGTLVLAPLAAGELELGYLLVAPRRSASLELAAIATSVALALRQARQVDALEHRAEALRRANGALNEIARHDSLTGLANRAQFQENLERALAEARAAAEPVALLFLDLDGFKLINDTLGHGAGDQLLRIVASRIGGVLDPGTSLARLGGDEFTIIVREPAGARAATRIAERVLETVSNPFRLGERVVNVTTSIGIACSPDDGDDAETLVRNADTAMYHAKACGKSRHALYTASLNRDALAELELRESIRRGLDAGEFHLHFQPRVALRENRLIGFEALLRWRRRDGIDTGPARFVPVAERCGMIAELDALSLDLACRQASRWAAEETPVTVSVNLSVHRLQEPDIVEQVVAALRRHRLEPTLLELEITESAAMTDVEENIAKLGALRALGVRIAIDDFGTGHSSLTYLRRLPVNSLKVDRSFLSGIRSVTDAESADATIVRAIVALGRSLGFRIVAEGIESDVQLDFLRALGCEEGQGYRFGRPLDTATATRRLRASGDAAA